MDLVTVIWQSFQSWVKKEPSPKYKAVPLLMTCHIFLDGKAISEARGEWLVIKFTLNNADSV